eukprot:7845681-Alexandrium_andersonii.AAC.1
MAACARSSSDTAGAGRWGIGGRGVGGRPWLGGAAGPRVPTEEPGPQSKSLARKLRRRLAMQRRSKDRPGG